jgi:Pleckstrin homology domain
VSECQRRRYVRTFTDNLDRFGKLRLQSRLRVGKDRESWQELECYLFGEMLICVKEKKLQDTSDRFVDPGSKKKTTRWTLKGSILIKKHLREIEPAPGGAPRNFIPVKSEGMVILTLYRHIHPHPSAFCLRAALLPPSFPEPEPVGTLAASSPRPAKSGILAPGSRLRHGQLWH